MCSDGYMPTEGILDRSNGRGVLVHLYRLSLLMLDGRDAIDQGFPDKLAECLGV